MICNRFYHVLTLHLYFIQVVVVSHYINTDKITQVKITQQDIPEER